MTAQKSTATYLTLSAQVGDTAQPDPSLGTLHAAEQVNVLRTQRRWYLDQIARYQDLTGLHVDPKDELTALTMRARVAELEWVLATLFGVK